MVMCPLGLGRQGPDVRAATGVVFDAGRLLRHDSPSLKIAAADRTQ
jgi:hypothetical protein